MAVTLEKISKQAGYLYKMKLEAGDSGIKNIVQWVHIIEDKEVSNFLHGNELVFTTGIECDGDSWITHFVKAVHEKGASGIVVNIGPHIKAIPAEALQYCNQNMFPLFSVPWETKLVDITRDFCRKIMQGEQVEENIVSIFKDIIFEAKDYMMYTPALERRGFHENSNYAVLTIGGPQESMNASVDADLKFYVEKTLSKIGDLSITFTYDKSRIIILSEFTKEDIKTFINELTRRYLNSTAKYKIGISSVEPGVGSVAKNFRIASKTLALCIKKTDNILFYDELGIYKILLESNDYRVLEKFYNDTMKPLEIYDIENKTTYMDFVKLYLENNGSVQAVAEKMYVHRNTVNYQLNKIQKITGLDLASLEVKLFFKLCLYIKDII